jgi:hypothetical protein
MYSLGSSDSGEGDAGGAYRAFEYPRAHMRNEQTRVLRILNNSHTVSIILNMV